MFDPLFLYIRKFVDLTPECEHEIISMLRLQQLRKHQLLLQQGKVCVLVAFITRGLLRSYNKDEQDAEVTIGLNSETEWVLDVNSFLTQEPATQYIEALEDTEVITIDSKSWQQLQEQQPQLRIFSQEMLQLWLLREQARVVSLLRLSARQRYEHLLVDSPDLIQRVPQKYIASYLGMSPEFLSKIRRQLRQNGREEKESIIS